MGWKGRLQVPLPIGPSGRGPLLQTGSRTPGPPLGKGQEMALLVGHTFHRCGTVTCENA